MADAALAQSTQTPKDPQSGKDLWTCNVLDIGGQPAHVCIPNFLEVAGWFKGVQRAVNAWRRKKSKVPIQVDARIGPATVSAVNEYRKAENAGGPLDAQQIAALAVQLANEISRSVGATPNLDPQPKSDPSEIPTTVPPETLEQMRQDAKRKSNLKWWILGGVALAAVAGGAYYFYRRRKGQPLFGAGAPDELDDADYDDEPPPEFGNVIDV